METRTERYTRYRERIKNMSELEFPSTEKGKANFAAMEATLSSGAITIPGENPLSLFQSTSPYRVYLHHKRVRLLIKIIVAVVIVAGLIVWWFLMQGRAGK